MIKEELEKEAEEYRKEKLKEQKDKFVFELPEVYVADIKQAYLAGAESREKRIAELEAQIEKMKCGGNCKHEYWINTGGCYDQKCRFTGLDCTNCKDKWEIKGK